MTVPPCLDADDDRMPDTLVAELTASLRAHPYVESVGGRRLTGRNRTQAIRVAVVSDWMAAPWT